MRTLKRDSLVEGGFAGLKEHQLIKDPQVFGTHANKDGSWSGLESFVYLADARFMPYGETRMHSHYEVDVISIIVSGRIKHEGSLKHGQNLLRNDVQVQRAGGEGFSHNEINPDNQWNRMIQIWVLPEQAGLAADYKVYPMTEGETVRIYGDNPEGKSDFPAKTKIDIAILSKGQQLAINRPFILYITRGSGIANVQAIKEGDLIQDDTLSFTAQDDDVQLMLCHI